MLVSERVTIGRSQECLSRGAQAYFDLFHSTSPHSNKSKHVWITNPIDTEDFLQSALTYEKNVLEGENYQAEHKGSPVLFLLTI